MLIDSQQWLWLQAIAQAALFASAFVAVYALLRSLPRRRRRWPIVALRQWLRRKKVPAFVLRAFGLREGAGVTEVKERLLLESGWRIDPTLYELLRRASLLVGGLLAAFGFAAVREGWKLPGIDPVYVLAAGAVIVVVWSFDRIWLESLAKVRSQRVMKEIYMLSNQLLYYNGSKMSLHAKLSRCVPFCRTIRSDFQLLLHEWYEDAEQAIRRFKRRLGTEEAYSFAETINSLRLNEHDSYYSLLRDRIQDYKEKLELARDSRKETTSYVLFVLAGIPILNTFRIFVYPWVQEGQKLFDALN